jgi:hypothetical protein
VTVRVVAKALRGNNAPAITSKARTSLPKQQIFLFTIIEHF